VRSSFGTAGEVKVESLSGELEHFRRLRQVRIRSATGEHVCPVESVRVAHRFVIMKLAGVDTIDQATTLRGCEIVVPRSEAAVLDAGEYYYADLVGLRAVVGKQTVGRVCAIVEAGPGQLVEIDLADGRTVLVPFVDEFVGAIDLEGQTLEIRDETVLR